MNPEAQPRSKVTLAKWLARDDLKGSTVAPTHPCTGAVEVFERRSHCVATAGALLATYHCTSM
jgi:hypothetical protein